jgi:hypothetical protein
MEDFVGLIGEAVESTAAHAPYIKASQFGSANFSRNHF